MKLNNLFFLLIFIFSNVPLFAQSSQSDPIYFQFGIGLSKANFSGENTGINLNASLNYKSEQSIYSIGFLYLGEFILFTDPPEYIKSIDVKYGRVHELLDNRLWLFYRGGVSYNVLNQRSNQILVNELFNTTYRSKLVTGVGLPIEIGFQTNIFKLIGISTAVFANFNNLKPMYGFTSSLCIGLLY